MEKRNNKNSKNSEERIIENICRISLDEFNKEQLFKKKIENEKQKEKKKILKKGFFCSFCELNLLENSNEDQYLCTVCKKYTLCGECFENRFKNETHEIFHPMLRLIEKPEKLNIKKQFKTFQKSPLEEIDKNNKKTSFKKTCKGPCAKEIFVCDDCLLINHCLSCFKSVGHSPAHAILLQLSPSQNELNPNDIKKQKFLGKGSFGEVFLAKISQIKDEVVLKEIKINLNENEAKVDMYLNGLTTELSAAQELFGNNLIRMLGYCIDIQEDVLTASIVMEYMEKGTLADIIYNPEKRLSLFEKLNLSIDVIKAICRIHKKNAIHRDIKPENIFLKASGAKIGDFGIVVLSQEKQKKIASNVGTIDYLPEEYFDENYNESVDVYSFGLVFNEIFTETHHKINKFPFRIEFQNKSALFFDLIELSTSADPQLRPSAQNLYENLTNFKKYLILQKDLKKIDSVDDSFFYCEYHNFYGNE